MCCIKHRTIDRLKHNKYVIIVFFIFLIPRLISLGSDISNYDASYWYPRLDSFWLNLIQGEIFLTYQKYHPGVMLLWISGFSKYIFEVLYKIVYGYNPRFYAEQFIKLQIATLLPLMIILSAIGASWYYYLSRIINHKFALVFCLLISIEPFFLGISKFVHVTAPASFFIFTSFLSLYYHLYMHSEPNSLITKKNSFYISSVFLGFALLTKIDSLIIGLFNSALILYAYKKDLISGIKHVIQYTLISIGVFYILFPAMWISPITVITKMYNEGIRDNAFNSEGAGTITNIKALYYLEVFFYRTLPTTFISFILSLHLMWKTKVFKDHRRFFIISLVALIFLIVMLTIPEKIKDRYLFNMLPFFLLFSSITFYFIWNLKNSIIRGLILYSVVFMYILTAYRYYPVYSFYHSDLIGGAYGLEKFNLPVPNRGEYYAQAAQYLNRLSPDPHNKITILDHREQTRTFSPFFYGTTYTNPNLLPNNKEANYILSRRDMDYIVPKKMCQLIKTFGPKDPNHYDVILIYECKGITKYFEDFNN